MINICETCRYWYKRKDQEPCKECRTETGVNWKPKEEKKENRPKPMPNAAPYYDRESSRIPDKIRVSFTDGTTAVYTLNIEQPAPMVVESLILREEIEYEYKPRRRRRTRE